jgi:hypothetical protein
MPALKAALPRPYVEKAYSVASTVVDAIVAKHAVEANPMANRSRPDITIAIPIWSDISKESK